MSSDRTPDTMLPTKIPSHYHHRLSPSIQIQTLARPAITRGPDIHMCPRLPINRLITIGHPAPGIDLLRRLDRIRPGHVVLTPHPRRSRAIRPIRLGHLRIQHATEPRAVVVALGRTVVGREGHVRDDRLLHADAEAVGLVAGAGVGEVKGGVGEGEGEGVVGGGDGVGGAVRGGGGGGGRDDPVEGRVGAGAGLGVGAVGVAAPGVAVGGAGCGDAGEVGVEAVGTGWEGGGGCGGWGCGWRTGRGTGIAVSAEVAGG